MPNILDKIFFNKRVELDSAKRKLSLSDIKARIVNKNFIIRDVRKFLEVSSGSSIIAEIKPRTPFKGELLKNFVNKLLSKNIRVSVFIEPEKEQINAAKSLGSPVIELHTGAYCNAIGSNQSQELNKLIRSAKYAVEIGLECHAWHGLGFNTVSSIASIQEICELNIGHFLIGESIFSGLEHAVQQMRVLMDSARDKPNKETRA